ncbi:hypothetical protein PINS_up011923 [Pythium insidiosum]|nr:hypothetical protein PINS_up011923 [Pythium insidiosum]
MGEEERRLRHREVQRQFMQRKRARLDDMRSAVIHLEVTVKYLRARSEQAQLVAENNHLHTLISSIRSRKHPFIAFATPDHIGWDSCDGLCLDVLAGTDNIPLLDDLGLVV